MPNDQNLQQSHTTIQLKRGLAASWTTKNIVLAAGEIGFETDTNRMKVGDGTKTWNQLPYTKIDLTIDDALSLSSTNPVQNKVVTEAIAKKDDVITTITVSNASSLTLVPGSVYKWTVPANTEATVSFDGSQLSGKFTEIPIYITLSEGSSVTSSTVTSNVTRSGWYALTWDGTTATLKKTDSSEAQDVHDSTRDQTVQQTLDDLHPATYTPGNVVMFDENGHPADGEVPANNIAKKDGYYAANGLGAATAEQLIDPNATPEAATFGFRTSAGDVSITDGKGIVHTQEGSTEMVNQIVKPSNENSATGSNGVVQVSDAVAGDALALKMVAPRSVVVNQLISNVYSASEINGLVRVNNQDGSVSISGQCTNSSTYLVTQSFNVVATHVYLVCLKGANTYTHGYVYVTGGFVSNAGVYDKKFTTSEASDAYRLSIYVTSGDTINLTIFPMVVDLTQYFNGDQTLIDSITSWDDLVAYDPRFASYVEYNTGTVEGVQPTVKVTGKNLFDAENAPLVYQSFVNDYVVARDSSSITFTCMSVSLGFCLFELFVASPSNIGTYTFKTKVSQNNTTPLSTSVFGSTMIVSSNFDGTNRQDVAGVVRDVTADSISLSFNITASLIGRRISARLYLSSNSGDISSGDVFKFYDIQLELGNQATSYEPYHDGGSATSPSEMFAVGSAADTFEAVGGVNTHKMASVDLGTLDWGDYASSDSYTYGYTSAIVTGRKYGDKNLITAAYITDTDRTHDKIIFGYRGGQGIVISDSSLAGKTKAQLQSALSGKTLYFELDEPTTTQGTANTIAMQAGNNTVMQTDGGRTLDSIELGYDGTNYNLKLVNGSKYIVVENGVASYITASSSNNNLPVVGGQTMVHNLTQWFGKGYEPASVAAFYARYPSLKGYVMAYLQGQAINYKGTGIRTRGFNCYNPATGTAVLLGGNKYQICGTYTAVSYTDRWGNAETLDIDEEGIFTPVNDGTLTVTGGNATDTCVHLTWSGYKNYGKEEYQWEPYWEVTTPLHVLESFPDGMNGIGEYRDMLTPTGYVKQCDKITLNGTENWQTYVSGNQYRGFQCPMLLPMILTQEPYTCRLSHRLLHNSVIYYADPDEKLQIWIGATNRTLYVVWDKSSTTSKMAPYYNEETDTLDVTAFKSWLAAAPLEITYVLYNNSISVTFPEPVRTDFPVSDFGTEELIPADTTGIPTTTWLDGKIQYNQDFLRLLINYSKIYSVVKHLADNADRIVFDDDTAPNLIAGNAYNLIDREAQGTLREFSYDSVNGTNDVTDGTAIAQSVHGQTLMANQQVQDHISKPVSNDSQVEVEDAIAGDISSLVVEGRSLVRTQLVPPNKEKTASSSNGVISVNDGIVESAKGLVMTASRSVVANQLVDYTKNITSINTDAASVTNDSNTRTSTMSILDNVLSTGIAFSSTINKVYVNHVYLFTALVTASQNTTTRFLYSTVASPANTVDVQANTETRVSFVSTITSSSLVAMLLYVNVGGTLNNGDSVIVKDAMVIDLTQYFNGDQTLIASITSWDDLVAYDPRFASYVEYNTGEVAGVQPTVKVSGKNLLNINRPVGTLTSGANPTSRSELSDDYVYLGLTFGNYYYPDRVASYTIGTDTCSGVTGHPANCGLSYPVKVKANTQYTISCLSLNGRVRISFYSKDGNTIPTNEISMYASVTYRTFTTPVNCSIVLVTMYSSEVNTAWEVVKPQLELGSTATDYEPYHDGGTAASPVPLYGVGTAADSYDAVTGKVGHMMASVDLGTLDWYKADYHGYTRFQANKPSDAKNNSSIYEAGDGLICSMYFMPGIVTDMPVEAIQLERIGIIYNRIFIVTDKFGSLTNTEFANAMSGVMLYYELDTPTTSQSTPTQISLQAGNNVAMQTDGGRTAPFSLTYDGTEFTLPLDSTHKYAFSDNGVKSIITSSSEQAVTGGQDMLVDVTRMFNGDTTAINAITSWADMAAVMPEYLSNVAYNEGEVVARGGKVTTAVWNQLYDYGVPLLPITGAYNYGVITSHDASTRTDVQVVQTQAASIGFRTSTTLPANHTYLADFDISYTGTGTQNLTFGYTGAYTTVFNTAVTRGSTVHIAGICAIANERKPLYIYVNMNTTLLEVGAEITLKNLQLFDLTEIYGAGYEPSTVEEFEADCAKWGKDLTQYQPYDAGTPMGGQATFTNLHGVGMAKDTQDVVTGAKTVKMASVDLGTLDWTYSSEKHLFSAGTPVDAAASVYNTGIKVCCDLYVMTTGSILWATDIDRAVSVNSVYWTPSKRIGIRDLRYTTVAAFTNAMSGVYLYYELAEPTTSTETAQPMTVANGLNIVHEDDVNITGTPLTMTYTGTDQTIATDTSRKYLKRINGADSVVDDVSSIDARGGRDRIIDLTYMFGAGNEPATASDFYKLFPTWLGYAIPYNKGSLVNFKGTGLKSVGFNLLNVEGRTLGTLGNTVASNTTVRGIFDETKYYVGLSCTNYYSSSAVSAYSVSSTSISVTNNGTWYGVNFPVRCVPGRTYRWEFASAITGNNRVGISFYTYNGTWISGYDYGTQSVEAPANAYWVMFSLAHYGNSGTSVFTNPCLHLQWSGGRNGDYEPYWDYTRPLPTLTYFQQGMNGRGQVYDEVTSRQAITRLAEVDMEDLEWTEGTGTWTATISGMKSNTTTIVAENGYNVTVSGTSVTIASDTSPVGKLVYEMATPTTVTFPEEMAVTAQVSDYGTESVVPVNGYELTTAPFLGIVKYQDNYARAITKLKENYISKESMEMLIALIGQLHNGTIDMTYNAETGKYTFDYTPNA